MPHPQLAPGMTQPHSPGRSPQPPMTPPTITQEATSLTSTGPIQQQAGPRPETTPSRTVWRAGLAAAGIAAAANLAVFALAHAAGTPLRVRFPAHQAAASVAAGDVLGASLAALAIGTAVTALLLRRLRHGLAAGQLTGAVITLLSLAIPLGVHASAGTKAALAAMHLIAGTAFVAAMGRAKAAPTGTEPAAQHGSAAYDKAA